VDNIVGSAIFVADGSGSPYVIPGPLPARNSRCSCCHLPSDGTSHRLPIFTQTNNPLGHRRWWLDPCVGIGGRLRGRRRCCGHTSTLFPSTETPSSSLPPLLYQGMRSSCLSPHQARQTFLSLSAVLEEIFSAVFIESSPNIGLHVCTPKSFLCQRWAMLVLKHPFRLFRFEINLRGAPLAQYDSSFPCHVRRHRHQVIHSLC
jgi:hypothetical protein